MAHSHCSFALQRNADEGFLRDLSAVALQQICEFGHSAMYKRGAAVDGCPSKRHRRVSSDLRVRCLAESFVSR
jgi:hypothetical protein